MRRSADVSPTSTSLFAFKPRQVLLLEQQQRSQAASKPMAKNKPEKAAQLKPEDESILTFSVALWLENKGLSKVLKRFLSATQIQDNWKAKALNLNEIFSRYQEIRAHDEDLKKSQKQEEQVVGTTEKNGDANGISEEILSKKKKKKSKGDVAVNDKGRTLEVTSISEKMNESYVNGNETESRKASGPINDDQNTKSAKESNGDIVPEIVEDQSSKKKKEKNKKKSKLTDADEKQTDVMPEVTELKDRGSLSKSSAAELLEREITVDKKSKKRSSEGAEDGVNESKKASKKRKRMALDENENENQSGKEVPVEESKSKNSKGLEVSKDDLQKTALPGANGHTGELAKGVTSEAVLAGSENLSAKQSDESIKNAINSNGMDKSSQKSANKQPKSSEPKIVKAFQRVKADEVEFVDERLQDNSYWAKDGAETGYGAKAQEVLGQVKGRDFRHEKTKKKRGSYRGGQIDLHSHSIKFNYSDEE